MGSLFFYSGMRTHSSFFSALSSENYKRNELKSESGLPNSNEFIKTVSPISNLRIFVNKYLLNRISFLTAQTRKNRETNW